MKRVGPNGTYKDNRTLGREYAGQVEVEEHLKRCLVPPRNDIKTDGLTDEEFRQVDAVIRKNTLEKFGPVRSVKPSLVFELGFEGINRSPRHKSGIAVRFPRMLRIRHDKPVHEADSLEQLETLLKL